MPDLDGILSFSLFFLGAIIGSFLNVCIVRLPHGKSVVFPSSHCVHCQKAIAWHDNIPLLSYLFLAGRCRHCKGKISFRYFLVELLTAVSFLLFYKYFGFHAILIPYLVMLCGFIVATFVDFEHRIIPDEISVGGTVVGVVFSLLIPQLHGQDIFWKGGLWSVVGLLAGAGPIYRSRRRNAACARSWAGRRTASAAYSRRQRQPARARGVRAPVRHGGREGGARGVPREAARDIQRSVTAYALPARRQTFLPACFAA